MGTEDRATALAKVLWYYGLVPTVQEPVQKIVCPFHGDVNPSLLVNIPEGSWFCFGCNEAGDAEKFVRLMERKYHGANDLQAYRTFLSILHADRCSDIRIKPGMAKRARPKKQLYNEAYDYYHGLATIDWTQEDLCPEALEAREYMLQRGFTAQALNACKAKVTYNNQYSLIFPMTDNGKFRGWVSRTMLPELAARRKYLYNEGFSRATTLCGSYGEQTYVFVVEGYMDRLKFLQNGITNVVAVLGWKMSQQQFAKLKAAGVTHVISALDNDEAGKRGTQYLQVLFGRANVTRWCYLKGLKDPGEASGEQFKKMHDRTMARYRAQQNV